MSASERLKHLHDQKEASIQTYTQGESLQKQLLAKKFAEAHAMASYVVLSLQDRQEPTNIDIGEYKPSLFGNKLKPSGRVGWVMNQVDEEAQDRSDRWRETHGTALLTDARVALYNGKGPIAFVDGNLGFNTIVDFTQQNIGNYRGAPYSADPTLIHSMLEGMEQQINITQEVGIQLTRVHMINERVERFAVQNGIK